jgi:hypothetical protein
MHEGCGFGFFFFSLFVRLPVFLMGIEVKTKLVKILKELFVLIYRIRA